MKVPFVDLQAQFETLKPEILPAITRVMERTAFILGDEVDAFERNFAAFCGAQECVGVGSGCDALLWGIKACGLGPGEEIITVANTYIATVLAITMSGATPVLVDCLEDSYEIDPEAVRRAITPRTRAILPVHMYGQAADMDALGELRKAHGLKIIEDAAQAHGAKCKERPCGSMGEVGCFSFYPGKNLGAYGDGGAIVTNDAEIANKVRMYRNYGQSKKHYHDIIGWNSRLDTVQAAVLEVKLKHLADWNTARHAHADSYRERLADLPVTLPAEMPGNYHIYHLFVIRVERRDELFAFLQDKDVSCGMHYPVPVYLQKAYADLGHKKGDFPVAERLASEILSLPMFPELTEEQIDYACSCIREFYASGP
jgi:dTDP-4-amino-4,6-dideoxygalactose transaminase